MSFLVTDWLDSIVKEKTLKTFTNNVPCGALFAAVLEDFGASASTLSPTDQSPLHPLQAGLLAQLDAAPRLVKLPFVARLLQRLSFLESRGHRALRGHPTSTLLNAALNCGARAVRGGGASPPDLTKRWGRFASGPSARRY